MPNFHHHPDNLIFVRVEGQPDYCDTPENFALDFGAPYTDPPQGSAERYYEPGVSHYLSDGATATPQPLSWPQGDAYIAAHAALMSAKAAREA